MATQAQPAPDQNPKLVDQLSPWADVLSKTVAAIAIGVYACGFIIVSLHEAKYGFVGTNPFRPRVLAAGAWFLFFAAVPVIIGARYRAQSWSKVGQDLYPIWLGCIGLSFTFSWILFELSEYPPDVSPITYWWVWLIAGAIAVALLMVLQNSKKIPRAFYAIATSLITAFFVAYAVRESFIRNFFGIQALSLWFFICIGATIFEVKTRRFVDSEEWVKTLGTLFALLVFFAHSYYPHLKASWGGGTPMTATIYFTRDSPVSPNKSILVQLIEESDQGFYIVGAKESKAIFVPRSAVAMVYFSDKPSDSALLSRETQSKN